MTSKFARTTCALLAATVCALAFAAASLASIPKLKSTLIVPNKSLGPLKLKVSYKTATKEIGTKKGGHCEPSDGCSWGTEKSGQLTFQMAAFATSSAPFVAQISISAPSESPKGTAGRYFTGPLMKLKTAKKIGLGSTTKSLVKAYPKLKKESLGGSNAEYTIEGSGPAATRPQTDFIVQDKRVVTISVQAIALG